MQVHGPSRAVDRIDVGEYHLGAVTIYLGPVRLVTHSEANCDMLIAAACEAKAKHAGAVHGAGAAMTSSDERTLSYMRAALAGVALPDEDGA